MSKLTRLLFLFLIVSNAPITKQENPRFLLQISNALEKVLDFVLKHDQSMNIDGIFGVIIATAFLDEIEEEEFPHKTNLERLKLKANLIYNTTRPRLLNDSDYKIRIFAKHLLDPEKWKKNIMFHNGNLYNFVPEIEFDARSFLNYLNSAELNETFSDQCILELINPTADNSQISQECTYEMVDRKGFGPLYITTHRLLYLQIARIQKRIPDNNFMKQKIRSFCSYILWETKTVERFNLINLLNDAVLEEITLCSLEGFAEFMQKSWVFEVINMQEPEGCYKATENLEDSFENISNVRKKRTANIIEFGCIDHTTGLGASTLSAFLNYYAMNIS